MTASATLNEQRTHRYDLRRVWDEDLPPFLVIGLNPSTADENVDDPTIRRCIGFAKREGCGSLVMCNLFSFRSTDPKALAGMSLHDLGDGIANYQYLDHHCAKAVERGGRIVAAWGADRTAAKHHDSFGSVFARYPLECFGFTMGGAPRHPLYLKTSEILIPFSKVKL